MTHAVIYNKDIELYLDKEGDWADSIDQAYIFSSAQKAGEYLNQIGLVENIDDMIIEL